MFKRCHRYTHYIGRTLGGHWEDIGRTLEDIGRTLGGHWEDIGRTLEKSVYQIFPTFIKCTEN